MACVFGHFDKDEHYTNFREYVAAHVKHHDGFEDIHALIPDVPLYPYLAKKISLSLESLVFIDWHIALLIQAVLVGQALLHYYLHLAVVELLPITVLVASSILAFQFIWTRRRAAYVVDKANQASSASEGRSDAELE